MTEPMSIERLRREGEAFSQELALEFYHSLSGLKPDAQLQPLYQRYRAIFSDESLEVAREMFTGSANDSDDRRSARILLDWQVESRSSRQLAPLDEREIAWEGEASVRRHSASASKSRPSETSAATCSMRRRRRRATATDPPSTAAAPMPRSGPKNVV